MSEPHTISEDVMADMQAVVAALASGTRVDEETRGRIRKRGEKIRKEWHEKHGQTEMAVDLIRQVRDEG